MQQKQDYEARIKELEQELQSVESDHAKDIRDRDEWFRNSQYFQRRVEELETEVEKIKGEAEKDYKDMRRFQAEVIRLTHENNSLESQLAECLRLFHLAIYSINRANSRLAIRYLEEGMATLTPNAHKILDVVEAARRVYTFSYKTSDPDALAAFDLLSEAVEAYEALRMNNEHSKQD